MLVMAGQRSRGWSVVRAVAPLAIGGVAGAVGMAWLLGDIALYQNDLVRLYRVEREAEDAVECYVSGDASRAAESLERFAATLESYLAPEVRTVFVPDKNAHAGDLVVTYERLARIAEGEGRPGVAAGWRARAAGVVRTYRPWKDPSYEFVSAWVDRLDEAAGFGRAPRVEPERRPDPTAAREAPGLAGARS